MEVAQWNNPVYRETVLIVLVFLFLLGSIFFVFHRKNAAFLGTWASLKSWLFAAPVILLVLGLPYGWALASLTLVAIFGSKTFFQITGMYHRSNFVWICYIGIAALAYAIYIDWHRLYDLMPMIFLFTICMVPLIRNNYIHMIQYIALTLIGFSLLGWNFMHLGWILKLDNGPFLLIYIILLTEFCENALMASSKLFGHIKPFSRITSKRTLEGFVVALFVTVALAWGMRHLMPSGFRSPPFWIASGIVAACGGALGDLVLTVVRRDLGIKQVGAFIIGRGDFLRRVDRLIFVAPIYFYVMKYMFSLGPMD
ncbi:MAG: phosphatidate cytidylyltransferase [Proteobacteria bacterium SG_bin7]|nr:MAG: phosphatidate cytidylyltransferase [Proteobacteria bacterium SG_bin7]